MCREESLFLYETRVGAGVEEVLRDLVNIHNGRRKILRIMAEVSIPSIECLKLLKTNFTYLDKFNLVINVLRCNVKLIFLLDQDLNTG